MREPHALPLWMGRSGWCCSGVSVCHGGQVWVSTAPCCPTGAPALAASQRGSPGLAVWEPGPWYGSGRGSSARCMLGDWHCLPVASPATEAQTPEYSTPVPDSSEMELPGTATPGLSCPMGSSFHAGARGAAPLLLSARRKDPRTPQHQPQGRNEAAARHSRSSGGHARPPAPRLCSQWGRPAWP